MKIAYFLSEFPVISETFILNQITGLLDLGHEIDILVLRRSESDIVHQDVNSYGLLNKIRLTGDAYEHMPRNKLKRLIRAGQIYLQVDKSHKRVLWRCLNRRRHGRDAWNLTLFYRAWKMLAEGIDYDIVHCHFGNNGRRAAAMRAVGALNAPVVTTFHGHDITQDVVRKGAGIYTGLFNDGSLFLPVSRLWEQELIRLGCPAQKIQVHRMGIDVEQFCSNEHQPKPLCTVLTVARLVEKKGIRYAIAAIKKVVAEFGSLRYQIVGSGPLEAELAEQIREAGLQQHIQMLGWKNQREIEQLTAAADIFLLPSVTASSGDKEGVPVVLMEAMARSIPVVSTEHSGIPELVDSGQSGFLVPERDSEMLAERLLTLIKEPALREKMGACGRSKVLAEFNIRSLNEQLLTRFDKLL